MIGVFFGGQDLPAQYANPEIEAAIEKFHLDRAETLLTTIPNAALRQYYFSRILFLRNIATDDPAWEEPLYLQCQAAIDEANHLPNADPLRRLILAEVHFQRGVIRILKKSYFSGANDLRRACELANRNNGKFPDRPDQMKLAGTFQLVLSAVPRNLQWLSSLLCTRGDMEEGVRLLETCSAESKILPAEAEVLLFFFEKNFISEPDSAHQRIVRLNRSRPNHFIYRLLLAASYLELRKTDEALKVLKDDLRFRQDPELFFSPTWDLYRARAHYYKLELGPARKYFRQFLETYQGTAFKGDAAFRLGITYELSGNHEQAVRIFKALNNTRTSGFDADSYASAMSEKYAARPMSPAEIELFRARNLFDGGYYQKSLQTLENMKTLPGSLSEDEKTERQYRFGRNYDALRKDELALKHYGEAIRTEPGDNLWMKVYATYYRGKVLERQGKGEMALKSYAEALEYDDYFYQSGLERRAKSALQQLERKLRNYEGSE